MWDDVYKKEQENLKAPEFLKVKTLQKMEESNVVRRRLFAPKLILGLSFSFLAVVLAFNFFNFNTPVMVTDLTFEPLVGAGFRFGVITDDEITLIEAEQALGTDVSIWELTDFYLQNVSWRIDEDHVRIHYSFERESASIQVMLNNSTETVSTNSILNDFPLALYYQVMLLDTTFIAEFLHHDIYYQIQATGLTEEEFITYLSKIINFLN